MPSLDLDRLGEVRTDWTLEEARALNALPFNDLLYHAQRVHRLAFDPNRVQVSTLLSVKTGACPEDCAYCPQSVRYETGVEREDVLDVAAVVAAAEAARAGGATRFCMGAAYRSPKPKQLEQVKEMVRAVHALGLETCATLGMLTPGQARELKDAGLDYYNHNLDTSEAFYGEIITTRTYQDRLDTLESVRDAGPQGLLRRHPRHGRVGTRPRAAAAHARDAARAPGERADQPAGAGQGHAARRPAAARPARPRAHHRDRAAPDAALLRAAVRRPHRHERRGAGAVLPRGRQLDLLRRAAAHDAEPRQESRRRTLRRASASSGRPPRTPTPAA